MVLKDIKKAVFGDVVLPGDPGYTQASTTFFHTGAPAVVIRPRDTDGIAAGLRYAGDNKLTLSVRSGGHGGPGFGTNTDGMVVDLSSFDGVQTLDPDAGVVRLGAGARWGRVAETLQEHGRSLSSGDTKSVGVGGLTLCGGIGWMVRTQGLTIDNLLAATVITADGTLRRVSADEHPDLFWAIRGGGGNFGVVVDFDFATHRPAAMVAGTIQYRLDNAADMIKRWRAVVAEAPEELCTAFCVLPGFNGNPPSAITFCCYAGEDPDEAARAIDPLLEIGAVVGNDVAVKPYTDILVEPALPPGIRVIAKNTLVRSVSDELISTASATYGTGERGALVLRSIGGAMSRVPADATAFAHRDVDTMVLVNHWMPAESTPAEVEEALRPWNEVAALGDGCYANFLGTSTPDDLAASYPPQTYRRLAEIKAVYDPTNLFDQNHNIEPV